MIPFIKELFDQLKSQKESGHKDSMPEHEIRLAVAALLIEIARADFEFTLVEQRRLKEILKQVFKLDDKQLETLVAQAESQVDNSVSLDQFSRLLDINLQPAEKVHVLELLWLVAFADGHIDKYEEYLIRKLADLLHVSHKGYITAKLKAEKTVKEAKC